MTYVFPTQLLEGRAKYLAVFHQLIDSIRAAEPAAVVELMLLIGDGSNPHGSQFNLPLRIDIVSGPPAKPKLTAVELDEYAGFQTVHLRLPSGRSAKLCHFPWYHCDVIFRGSSESWSPVLAWFDDWFDIGERNLPDQRGLTGVIHSMSEPKGAGSQQCFTVDFGSAPIEAFEKLINVLDGMELLDLEFGVIVD